MLLLLEKVIQRCGTIEPSGVGDLLRSSLSDEIEIVKIGMVLTSYPLTGDLQVLSEMDTIRAATALNAHIAAWKNIPNSEQADVDRIRVVPTHISKQRSDTILS